MIVLEGELDQVVVHASISVGQVEPADGNGSVFLMGLLDRS